MRLRYLTVLLTTLALGAGACGDDTEVRPADRATPVTVSESPAPTPAEDEDLPPIVVASPEPGAEASSPLKISGSADVFEANVEFRLVAAGEEIARGFTTATCGSGCRGDYLGSLRFEVDTETEAVLEVFQTSAEDGSPTDVVEVPVTLLPS